MSAREWKPGDVAVITERHGTIGPRIGSWWASKDDKGWASLDPSIGWLPDGDVAEARPLLVIDPEDRERVERLWRAQDRAVEIIRKHQGGGGVSLVDALQMGLRLMLDPTPPKPPEPQGMYAAVRDSHDNEWVRMGNGPAPWVPNGSPDARSTSATWASIDAVEVLSEGVQP